MFPAGVIWASGKRPGAAGVVLGWISVSQWGYLGQWETEGGCLWMRRSVDCFPIVMLRLVMPRMGAPPPRRSRLNAGGRDVLPDLFDGLHNFPGGFLARIGDPTFICPHPAFVDAGIFCKLADIQEVKVIEE